MNIRNNPSNSPSTEARTKIYEEVSKRLIENITNSQLDTYAAIKNFLPEQIDDRIDVENRRGFLRIILDRRLNIPASIIIQPNGDINITIDPVEHKRDFQYHNKENGLNKDNCQAHIQALPAIIDGKEPDETLFRKKPH